VYRLTLLPGVGYTGDTAKFQFLGKVLGTPHATGYPTYLVLNHIFVTVFPWGSLAFRANLMSAVCGALACAVVFMILRRLDVRPWIALSAMLTLGLSPEYWSQCLVAEVYSLNALFIALVLYQLLAWSQEGERRRLWAAILIYAISIGNHMTMILLFPGIAFFILRTAPRIATDGRTVLWSVGSLLTGVGQYGYLIWRYHDPKTPFLEVCVPGLPQLWNVVTGAQFRVQMFNQPLDRVMSERLPMVCGLLWRELGWLLLIAALGIVVFRRRSFLALLLLCLAGNLLFTLNYEIFDIEVYILPAVLLATIFVANGFEFLWSRLAPVPGRVTAPLLLGIPLVLFLSEYATVGQQHNVADARRIEALLRYVDKDALLVGLGYTDFHYASYYLLGEQWQEARHIYAVNYFRQDEFLEYFRHGIPITLNAQRLNTPTGLTVYVRDKNIVEQFQGAGLIATPVEHGLWRMDGTACASP